MILLLLAANSKLFRFPQCGLIASLRIIGITHVDFLSLDVEGHELEVLKTIDFSKVTIDVITVENDYNDESIREILYANGFMLFGRVHVDDIFVRKDLIS